MQGSAWEGCAGPENSWIGPTLGREWNSRTSKQWDCDQQVWKPLAPETGLLEVKKPALLSQLLLSFIKTLPFT